MMQKTKGEGKSVFQVWMLEESDLIQATAKSFGERICVEEFAHVIQKENDSGLK
jgi:acyl-CoA oxidase